MDGNSISGNKGTYISFWAYDDEMRTIQYIIDALMERNIKANRSQAVRYAILNFDVRRLPVIPEDATLVTP
jgi:hypothetical protein